MVPRPITGAAIRSLRHRAWISSSTISAASPAHRALQNALTTEGVGDIELPGRVRLGDSTPSLLLAYENTTTHEIDIADITIVNNSSGTYHDTDQAGR